MICGLGFMFTSFSDVAFALLHHMHVLAFVWWVRGVMKYLECQLFTFAVEASVTCHCNTVCTAGGYVATGSRTKVSTVS